MSDNRAAKTPPEVQAWINGPLRKCLGDARWRRWNWQRMKGEIRVLPSDCLKEDARRFIRSVIVEVVCHTAVCEPMTNTARPGTAQTEAVLAWTTQILEPWLCVPRNVDRCVHTMAAARRLGKGWPEALMGAIATAVLLAAQIEVRPPTSRPGPPGFGFSLN